MSNFLGFLNQNKPLKNNISKDVVISNDVLVDEIHQTFFTEVDRLLETAKISNSLETDKQELIDKCNRLKALGFKQTIEIVEAEKEIKRLEELKNDNENKKNIIEAINYFSAKYPIYKFITEDSVINICKKYELIYGTINKFKGSVPDKNLKQMEIFKISDSDKCYVETVTYMRSFNSYAINKIVDYDNYKNRNRDSDSYRYTYSTCPLEIAAPAKDFDTSDMKIENFKLVKAPAPDPVVLQPVLFGGIKYYLIVTAWGKEAEDNQVFNEIQN